MIRAIERAVEEHAANFEQGSDEVAAVVRRVLESDAADQVWSQVLESEQAQKLVERVAQAPEVRAAITAQGAGLVTDIGIRLTKITEDLDDTLERLVRRNTAEAETNQAGLATRVVAGAVDIGLLFGAYSIISGVIGSVIGGIFGKTPSAPAVAVLIVLGFLAGGAVFATFWSLAGQTPGMRFLSIRIVHDGSSELGLGRATRRCVRHHSQFCCHWGSASSRSCAIRSAAHGKIGSRRRKSSTTWPRGRRRTPATARRPVLKSSVPKSLLGRREPSGVTALPIPPHLSSSLSL